MNLNRLANLKNEYQTTTKKVLCVCSAGILRSPTLANVLHKEFGYNTRAVGCVKEYALIPIDDALLYWADEVVCMETEHINAISHFDFFDEDNTYLLNIPDEYSWNDDELKEVLLKRYNDINSEPRGEIIKEEEVEDDF